MNRLHQTWFWLHGIFRIGSLTLRLCWLICRRVLTVYTSRVYDDDVRHEFLGMDFLERMGGGGVMLYFVRYSVSRAGWVCDLGDTGMCL